MEQLEKIMILNGEKKLVDNLKNLLNSYSNKITSFSNFNDALAEIQKDNHYFLIFLDTVIPGMNSLEFIKTVKDLCSHMRFIIVSDSIDTKIAEEAKQFGLLATFNKPFDFEKIRNKVETVVKERKSEIEMDLDLRSGFLDEISDIFSDVENSILILETKPDDKETIEALFRAYHNLKGGAAAVGYLKLSKYAHEVENNLNKVRDGSAIIDKEKVDYFLISTDLIQKSLAVLKESPLNEDVIAPILQKNKEEKEEVEETPKKNVQKLDSNKIAITDDLTVSNLNKIMSFINFDYNSKYSISLEMEKIDSAGIQLLLSLKKSYDINIICKNQELINEFELFGVEGLIQ